MNISEICVKRPVLSIVLSLILIVIGIVGFQYLHTQFMPQFTENMIEVDVVYPGASAELVESSVTTPLEEDIGGIEGIDTISSESYPGESIITIELKDGFNAYEVSNKIRAAVDQAREDLPSGIQTPMVQTGHGESDLMIIGFTNPSMSLANIRDYLDRYVVDKIEQTPGISSVEIIGTNKYAMRIYLNPQKMHALNISVNDVETAIANSNVELPAGEIKSNSINYPITAKTKLTNANEFNNIIIKNDHGNLIRVKDIGHAALGSDSTDQSVTTVNNKPAVLLDLFATTDANPLDTTTAVNHLLKELQPQFPQGLTIIHTYQQADFMKDSISEVYESIFIAILCVVLVIFLFLGHLRSVIIPFVTIPICLIATFGAMYLFGFTINIITLLALVLSIGLVVDDSIVMLENIHRHIEAGEKPLIAAVKGAKEMTFAVIAMTLTLAAVYAPVAFIHGKLADVFQPFALTLAGAVIISGFVALTLSPMMCGHLLTLRGSASGRSNLFVSMTKRLLGHFVPRKFSYAEFIDTLFTKITHGYQRFLNVILKFRWLVVCAAILIAIGGGFLLSQFSIMFTPTEDIGFIIGAINTRSGASINDIANQTKTLGQILLQQPESQYVVTIADTNGQAFNASFDTLVPFNKRNRSSAEISAAANAVVQQTPGLNASVFPLSFGGSMHGQLEFSIMTGGTYQDLYRISETVLKQLNQYHGLSNVQSTMKFDDQQYNLTVNRDVAGTLNVSVKNIDNTMAAMLGGDLVSTFNMDGKDYNVYVQALDKDLHNLNSINQFYVNSDQGNLVPISNLINITPVLSQQMLPHYNRMRSATITAQINPGYDLGEVVAYLQKDLPTILPSDAQYAFQGRAQNIVDSSGSMGNIFLLALVFIYLVLAAQFESFIDPLIILLVVPLSVVGALIPLKLIGGTINIYTIVGLVTLIGLIAKHGILITTFANHLREQGVAAKDALIQAASTRLRPILMTTLAMVFGVIPLMMTHGASAESRRQIGVVIAGGLVFGTFFSLVLVPVAYSFAARFKRKHTEITEA